MSQRRINVRGVVWRDGKILAVKHKESDGTESPYWAIPGGGLDPHEAIIDAVQREFLEETGVVTTAKKLLFIQQFFSKREGFTEELECIFEVEDSDAFDHVNLAATTHGMDEIARIEFVDPRAVPMMPDFLSEIDIESYVRTDRPVLVYEELSAK